MYFVEGTPIILIKKMSVPLQITENVELLCQVFNFKKIEL